MSGRNFFAELKRRNVYKVAAAYAVIAWLLIQAAFDFVSDIRGAGVADEGLRRDRRGRLRHRAAHCVDIRDDTGRNETDRRHFA